VEQGTSIWNVLLGIFAIYIFFKGIGYWRRTQALEKRKALLIKKYGEFDGSRIFAKTIWQGMTEDQLLESWGKPADINRTVYKLKTTEIWKYNQTGKNKFRDHVYLENRYVVGWKDS